MIGNKGGSDSCFQAFFDVWHDREITAGKDRVLEIDAHLNTAHIILLLVSQHFMNSDYCYLEQMELALERHERREARVIPVILRPVYWEKAPFAKLQVLPTNAEPVTSSNWHSLDDAFFNVSEGIRVVAEELAKENSIKVPHVSSRKEVQIRTNIIPQSIPLPTVEPSQTVSLLKPVKPNEQYCVSGNSVPQNDLGEEVVFDSNSEIGREESAKFEEGGQRQWQ